MNKIDPLSVQVSFHIRKPKGVEISRKALNELYLNWVETGDLPRNMEIRGIFWKNGNRHEPLNYWRWSTGSDLSVLIKGYKEMDTKERKLALERKKVESPYVQKKHDRGNHEMARETLQNALRTFRPF